MTTEVTFSQIWSRARRESELTAPEFDLSLTQEGEALRALADAHAALYIERRPGQSLEQMLPGLRASWSALWPQAQAAVERARSRSYTGWHAGSTSPVRYADAA